MEKHITSIESSIRDCMQHMDKCGTKTLIVADQGKLLGVISDGDIRRAILKGKSLTSNISGVLNSSPYFIKEKNLNIEKVKEVMLSKKFESIPVTNEKGFITKVLIWNEVFGKIKKHYPKLNMNVVIMAGGKGTRMKPFTNILPKPLLPIGEKTIIEVIMDEFGNYGINDFYLTVNFKKNLIKAYFEDLNDYNITYIEEETFLGTGGSLKYLDGIISKPFFVSNCDVLIKGRYHEMIDFHKNSKYDLSIIGSVQHYEIPYGVCEIENGGDLKKLSERPSYDFLVNSGMYILNPNVLKYIPKGKFYHITHLIEDLKKRGKKVGVYPVSEKSWIDVGQWSELNKVLNQQI